MPEEECTAAAKEKAKGLVNTCVKCLLNQCM